MTNLYWPVYKKLENEIIALSNHIHFDDMQISVYSIEIAQLLIRCVVEIEALAKDLYFKNGGTKPDDKDLFFDTDCLQFLEEKWLLSKKIVIVSGTNFYFESQENRILTPLKKANKRGSSSADWAKAYQAVKHNRSKDLTKGNIKHLVRAMAALFLLNLYYRDDFFDLGNNNTENFTADFSDLFDVKTHKSKSVKTSSPNSYAKGEDFVECVYLTKWKDEYKDIYILWVNKINNILNEQILNHSKVKEFIIVDGKFDPQKITLVFSEGKYLDLITNHEYHKMIINSHQKATKEMNFSIERNPIQYEAILNKQEL